MVKQLKNGLNIGLILGLNNREKRNEEEILL